MQLRRLVVMAGETCRPRPLLALPDVRGLLASVLAVVERKVGTETAPVAECRGVGAKVNSGQPPLAPPRGMRP